MGGIGKTKINMNESGEMSILIVILFILFVLWAREGLFLLYDIFIK